MATTLTRFDPLFEPLEEMMRRFAPLVGSERRTAVPEIKIDVEEKDDAYVVKAELPGVKKEDINVDIDGNVVTLRAQTKAEREEKDGGRVVRSERYYGELYRSFALAAEIDESKAEAEYSDGILKLTLPKKSNGGAKRLAIK
jgi:HSP20 family protein